MTFRKTPVEKLQTRRADFASRLHSAKVAAAEAKAALSAAALADDGSLDRIEAAARTAAERVLTIENAVADLDAQIAAEEAKLDAEARKSARDAALKKVRGWQSEMSQLRKTLTPLIGKAMELTIVNDRSAQGFAGWICGVQQRDMLPAALHIGDRVVESFGSVISQLEAGDERSDDLAGRINEFKYNDAKIVV